MFFDNWAIYAGLFVDLIIVASFALSIYWGYKRGLVNVITSLVAFVLAIVLTLIIYKPISNFLQYRTPLGQIVEQKLSSVLSETSLVNGELLSKNTSNLPSSAINFINKQAETVITSGQEYVVSAVSSSLAGYIIKLIAAFISFILVRTFLILFQAIFQLIAELPVILQIDKLGGIIYGFLRALISVYVLLIIITIVGSFIHNWNVMYAIDSSHLGNFLYNHNLLINIFAN